MSDTQKPFSVYVHGCPGFHNTRVCRELARFIKGSVVLRMGIPPGRWTEKVIDGTRRMWLEEQTEMEVRHILDDATSDYDRAKKHSWIFSDFRGMALFENSALPATEYERVANKLGQPFVHVILRCMDQRQDSLSILSRSTPQNDHFEFGVFRSIWSTENVPAEGKVHELEFDIGNLSAREIAKKIFDGIAETLQF